MAVLVTGGAGYIGSHMALLLADLDVETIVLDNLSTGFDWAVDQRVRFIKGEIGDIEFVSNLIKTHNIEEIVHFAGSIIVPESVSDPLKYYANNTCATRNLIEAAIKGGVKRFVFSSTAAVYGMTGLDPVEEDAALNPMSPYGRSKLMSEMMLADSAAAHDINYGVLRYFNVAGADPEKRSGQSTKAATHLIKVAVQTALGFRDHLDVFGTDYETPDGTCIRDYIHVWDLVAAHALLLEKMRQKPDNYTMNCGYGRGFSVREVIEKVKQVSGVDFTVNEVGRREGDPAAVIAGADKIRNVLGWQPRHDDLDDIVRSAFEWEKYLSMRNREG
ncbi:UDP-glucose 4-epimerase [hydrothermal vent metagenome]|uniref:UDP-glucose 4-epimerase n=1 Tax=hydrothermal vent metagenome TaxID=652676 RepID=A0A3B0TM19_9ZZZZ